MNKGTKIALIAMAALSLVCLIGVWSMFTNAKGVLERAKSDAVTEGNEILILLAGSWDTKAIELRTAPGYEPDAKKVAEWSDKLGPLVSGDLELVNFEVNSDLLIADLGCTAEFEKGQGTIAMRLTREPSNAWLLADFSVTPVP